MATVGSNAKFKIGLCQTPCSKDKGVSLSSAREAVGKAVKMGAEMVVLGEMFACPYATKFFREYGERIVPAGPLLEFLNSLKKAPSAVKFEDTLSSIEGAFEYTAKPFSNGAVSSKAGENAGSAKVFSLGKLAGLTEDETLALFGQHYRDVVASPEGTSHGNIRAFMKSGWGGVAFPEGLALAAKETGLKSFLATARKMPDDVKFEDTIKHIEEAFEYTAKPFSNGSVSSKAGENAGSAKVFSLGRMAGLSDKDTLALFGQHYRDVVASPDGTSHGNIRAFMKTGWAGIYFPEGLALSPKTTSEIAKPTVAALSSLALEHKVWLVGGSFAELEGDAVYNTCLTFSPDGGIVAKHRKVHLFDIDVPATATRPAMKFKESDVLTAGQNMSLVDLPWCRAGVGICYDVRFPELALSMRSQGAKLLVYPGAFNMTTGPAHWTLLGRGRAVDTQCYVAMASPSRSEDKTDYQTYGHSMLVNPWAEIVKEAEHQPDVVVVEVDPAEADRIRGAVPTSTQKRSDLYSPYAVAADAKDAKRPRL
eukprot:TRINITY_DN123667_c0_g1_i1.p1 TRINITY_DN123667_c0_g1~~TRINITY_DN123667_c0_g1_i1.p1  ORF type:complete len:568 (+),score=132.60 TRINITY_DN123667_c0_g1_i1:98-1705(+)